MFVPISQTEIKLILSCTALGGSVLSGLYTDLETGTQAENDNSKLVINCNDYTGYVDGWRVPSGSLGPQGGCGFLEKQAENKFNSGCTSPGYMLNSSVAFDYNAASSTPVPSGCRTSNINYSACVSPNTMPCPPIIPCPAPLPCAVSLQAQASATSDPVLKQQLLNLAAHYYLIGGDENAVISLLTGMNSVETNKILIPAYIHRGELDKADSLLANIPTSGTENSNFIDLYSTLLDMAQQGRTIRQMNASEETSIRAVASSSTKVRIHAQAILREVKGDVYARIPQSMPASGSRKATPQNSDASEPLLSIYPNPASDKVSIAFNTEEPSEIIMVNLLGNIVRAAYTQGKGAQEKEFDIADLPSGIYLVKILQGGKEIIREKLTLIR